MDKYTSAEMEARQEEIYNRTMSFYRLERLKDIVALFIVILAGLVIIAVLCLAAYKTFGVPLVFYIILCVCWMVAVFWAQLRVMNRYF